MDENTRMMIQLASMMMQNEKAIKEAQIQMSAAASNVIADELQNHSDAVKLNGISEQANVAGETVNSSLEAEVGQPLPTDLSKNSNRTSPNVAAEQSSAKKSGSDKPATIAQIMQSQSIQNIQAASTSLSTEGKIFVYNNLPGSELSDGVPKHEPSTVPAHNRNGPMSNTKPFSSFPRRRTHGITPIKNRYGRTLRPGIDNFGRFEAVANPGLIMHAMELLRQKDRKKRGPKEKDTFSVFMYCLPDKNSKLPKFSSLDPIERALVDKHQQEGYGYPAQDYINGIPRKTQLCLTFDEDKFHSFMLAIYPKLEHRLYDMYRIDKTRRLIHVDVKSPRQLKDMKYQGSVIVIPYDTVEDRPPSVIHRNFEDCYNNNSMINSSGSNLPLTGSLGNPLALMQNYTIPMTRAPEVVTDADDLSRVQSVFPRLPQLVSMPAKPVEPLTTASLAAKIEETATHSHSATRTSPSSTDNTNPFDTIQILCRASQLRSRLKPAKCIHIRPEDLYTDILAAYRDDPQLETHRLNICFQTHGCQDSTPQQHDDDVDAGSVLVMFWEEATRKVFTGNQDVVPVIDPSVDSDVFKICGRILVHGLVLDNYLPLKLSPATLCFMLTGSCSEKTLLASFYRFISESEKEILEKAAEEIQMGLDNFSPALCSSIKVLFGSYGCKHVPLSHDLVADMPKFAEFVLIRQPYWSLQQVKKGICQQGKDMFDGMTEDELLLLHQILKPCVPSILQRINYIYSSEGDMLESENVVKEQFEAYLMKMPKAALQRFLYQWCGYDCLCVTNLFVKFSGLETNGPSVMFCPQQVLLCLPSTSTSSDELRSLLDGQVQGLMPDL